MGRLGGDIDEVGARGCGQLGYSKGTTWLTVSPADHSGLATPCSGCSTLQPS